MSSPALHLCQNKPASFKKPQHLPNCFILLRQISPHGSNDEIVGIKVDLPICNYSHLLLYGIKLHSFIFNNFLQFFFSRFSVFSLSPIAPFWLHKKSHSSLAISYLSPLSSTLENTVLSYRL